MYYRHSAFPSDAFCMSRGKRFVHGPEMLNVLQCGGQCCSVFSSVQVNRMCCGSPMLRILFWPIKNSRNDYGIENRFSYIRTILFFNIGKNPYAMNAISPTCSIDRNLS